MTAKSIHPKTGSPAAILNQLARGPIGRKKLYALVKKLPGGKMALSRLRRAGLIEDTVQLAEAGKLARGVKS
ncbi:MAG TPA: hypothetical protein VD994_19925 [Prosthecobacter sp.]|nr:hypothetical protein [Prosthecobacter sp.]